MKIFEYAAFYLPDEDSQERPRIVVEPKVVLAKDEKQAAILAARALPEDFTDRLDRVEICVRPF